MQTINKKTLIVVLLLLLSTVFLAVYALPRALVTLTKASSAGNLSLENSYLIAGKILATADGKDEATISVFLRDKDSKAVDNKTVSLDGLSDIEPAIVKVDANGMASFKLRSGLAGQFVISAIVSGVPLSKTLTVTFR